MPFNLITLTNVVISGTLTGLVSPEWWMGVHMWAGYGVVGLIAFRLVWGVYGSEYSRVASFAYGPRRVVEYLEGLLLLRPAHHIGHNPAGAAMIFALALLLVALTATGLVELAGEEKQGPFAGVVSYEIGNAMKEVHGALADLLLILVGGHVLAIVAHIALTRDNVIKAMITGDKTLPPGTPLPSPRPARPGRAAAAMAAIVAVAAAALAYLATLPPLGLRALPENAAYAKECGACHDAYHPSLLPAAAWRAVMADLGDHFGDDASLAEPLRADIAGWLAANAGETWDSEAANRFRSLDPEQPMRITATPYWRRKHGEIPAAQFTLKSVRSKANCSACHGDAATGRFDDQAISTEG
jgi:cytochrome b